VPRTLPWVPFPLPGEPMKRYVEYLAIKGPTMLGMNHTKGKRFFQRKRR